MESCFQQVVAASSWRSWFKVAAQLQTLALYNEFAPATCGQTEVVAPSLVKDLSDFRMFHSHTLRPIPIKAAHALARLSTKAVRWTDSVTNCGQATRLNLLGFIKFSGFSSSTKMPKRAQAATTAIRGSARGAAKVKRATITAMAARQTWHSLQCEHEDSWPARNFSIQSAAISSLYATTIEFGERVEVLLICWLRHHGEHDRSHQKHWVDKNLKTSKNGPKTVQKPYYERSPPCHTSLT